MTVAGAAFLTPCEPQPLRKIAAATAATLIGTTRRIGARLYSTRGQHGPDYHLHREAEIVRSRREAHRPDGDDGVRHRDALRPLRGLAREFHQRPAPHGARDTDYR